MLATTARTLNYDCWSLVLDHFYGDFETLFRIMQVSKSFLSFTAPHLYGQLGDLANSRIINNWSERKCSQLATLLLISSGYLCPKADTQSFQDWFRNQLTDPLIDFYSTPLALNYFGFLTRLVPHSVGRLVCKILMQNDLGEIRSEDGDSQPGQNVIEGGGMEGHNNNRLNEIDQRFARLFTEITFKDMNDLSRWLPWTKDFCQLSKLILGKTPTGYFQNLNTPRLIEFVTIHNVFFPGTLVEIQSVDPLHFETVMTLNEIIESTKIHVLTFQWIQQQPTLVTVEKTDEAENSCCRWLKTIQEFRFHESNTQLETLYLSHDALSKEIWNLNKFLNHCRQLEIIDVRSWSFDNSHWDGLLSWAPQQLLETRQLSQSYDRSLVPVKEFSAMDIPVSPLNNAIDGFRYTLEKIVYSGLRSSDVIGQEWFWPLSRLKSLTLFKVTVSSSKLQLCSVLEELYFEDMILRVDTSYGEILLPTGLKRLTLLRCENIFSSMDINTLKQLYRLESLTLDHGVTDVSPYQLSDLRKPGWRFEKLKSITLYRHADLVWQNFFLKSCPFVKNFNSLQRTVSPNDNFWIRGMNNPHQWDWDFEKSEIRSLCLSGSEWTSSLSRMLRKLSISEPPSSRVMETSVGMTAFESLMAIKVTTSAATIPTTLLPRLPPPPKVKSKILFPNLNRVRLERVVGITSNGNFWSESQYDRLLMALMCRPKMRQVWTVNSLPSTELIQTRLEVLNEKELPKSVTVFKMPSLDDDEEDEEDNSYRRGCVLVVEEMERKLFYGLSIKYEMGRRTVIEEK